MTTRTSINRQSNASNSVFVCASLDAAVAVFRSRQINYNVFAVQEESGLFAQWSFSGLGFMHNSSPPRLLRQSRLRDLTQGSDRLRSLSLIVGNSRFGSGFCGNLGQSLIDLFGSFWPEYLIPTINSMSLWLL